MAYVLIFGEVVRDNQEIGIVISAKYIIDHFCIRHARRGKTWQIPSTDDDTD